MKFTVKQAVQITALALAPLMMLSACGEQPEGEPAVTVNLGNPDAASAAEREVDTKASEPTLASACKPVTFEGVSLTHCIADPAQHRIDMALAPRSGDDFGTLKGWARDVDASTIAFAMNGGMYGDDLRAVGYYVSGSDRLSELDTGDGDGNFYLKPNGVFYGTGGEWRILSSDVFLRTVGTRPEFGTQSGPMLVIDGKIHPEITENGPSRQIRNGVGVDGKGIAHFVISEAPLSFGQLARFYRDELKVPNALYLDGNVSSLWDPASGRMDGRRVGPIIVVTKKAAQ